MRFTGLCLQLLDACSSLGYLSHLPDPFASSLALGTLCNHKTSPFGEEERFWIPEASVFVRGPHETEDNENCFKPLGKRCYRNT